MKATYATNPIKSLGRKYPEPSPNARNAFQRDRDRIVHSTAFRRLEYKTQVFVNHEGDLYRTRLTHSIEVAQIARSIARTLQLDEDLTEAIALAHDLGHTPFGHAGQDALNNCMKSYGGFEHNLQSLRVVDSLEKKYASFDGLNLSFETREGILKHCSRKNAEQLGKVGERFLTQQQPSLEAQLTNIADQIAYNHHDIDDGLRSGLISIQQLCEVELFAKQYQQVKQKYPKLEKMRQIHEILRRMISLQINDLIKTSQENINNSGVETLQDVRACKALIHSSPIIIEQNRQLKTFLRQNLYQHHKVYRMTRKAQQTIEALFKLFLEDTALLPPEHQNYANEAFKTKGQSGKARIIADYIAGMTDRYAIKEHRKLFGYGEIF